MKSFLLRTLLAVVLLTPVLSLRAEDVNAVKARMSQRVGDLNALKARGAAGENNRGMLEAREGSGEGDNALIAAENKDREVAYAFLAQQTNTSTELVARARARQIAASAAPGTWIQGEDGSWKKK